MNILTIKLREKIKNEKIYYFVYILIFIFFSIITLNVGVLFFENIKPTFSFEIIIGFIFGNVYYFSEKIEKEKLDKINK